MSETTRKCLRCGTPMVAGVLEPIHISWQTRGAAHLEFRIPGVPTSWNPITAIKQGMSGEKENETFGVVSWRCPDCGMLELQAEKPQSPGESVA